MLVNVLVKNGTNCDILFHGLITGRKLSNLRYSRIVYFMNTLGAKDFSSAVSGFCQAYSGYFKNGHEVEKSTQLY